MVFSVRVVSFETKTLLFLRILHENVTESGRSSHYFRDIRFYINLQALLGVLNLSSLKVLSEFRSFGIALEQ